MFQNLSKNFKKLGQGFLDLLFPISCLICGADGTYLCGKCLGNLPRLPHQQCLVCQTPAPFGKTHVACVSRNTVDGSIAALSYKDRNVHKIIQTFKYNFVSDLALPLTEAILEELKKQNLADYFRQFAVVPVPLHVRRLNWRGFNQAELLAGKLAETLDLRIEKDLVVRKKFTSPQIKLDATARKRNMENAFNLIGDATDKKILLVDDVVTSGSTANELAKLFKQGKASEVWLITAAHG
ncbi:MAG: phosphoribosyltransferase family protein [Candidatus Doudnabacteria bacterium]